MKKSHWHLSSALPQPPLCSVLAFHPSAVPICLPPHSPTLSLCLSVWSQSDLPLGFCRQKEVINTATMTTGEPDTCLSSCILMALLGILLLYSYNSSSPAFTWTDIKKLKTDEGGAVPLTVWVSPYMSFKYADGTSSSMWDETLLTNLHMA